MNLVLTVFFATLGISSKGRCDLTDEPLTLLRSMLRDFSWSREVSVVSRALTTEMKRVGGRPAVTLVVTPEVFRYFCERYVCCCYSFIIISSAF